MRKIALVAFLFIIGAMLPIHASGATGGEVHVAYFYADDCGNCQSVEPLIESIEENYSFLRIERYNVKENYGLYDEIQEKYHSHYGVPTAFMGNRWYYFDAEEGNVSETLEDFKNGIEEYEKIGGVESPIQNGSEIVFPKPVCMLAFYNFSDEIESSQAMKFKKAMEENITYINMEELDISLKINRENFENLGKLTGRNISTPALFIGNKSFSMDDSNISNAVKEGKKFDLTGLQCPKYRDICIVFFYNPLCPECMEAKEKLEGMKEKYPIKIDEYNKISKEGSDMLFRYYNAFNISGEERIPFVIFIGDKYYYDLNQFYELENEIKKYVDTGLPCPSPSEEGSAEETLKGFTVLTVIAGGLVDGINPCAFATLVFFIAYMERVKHGKRALLSIGLLFSAGVFAGYLVIGIGLMEFYYGVDEIGVISKYIYAFAGAFALIISAFNVWDYFRIEKDEKTILQLPRFLKKRRGRIIKVLTGDRKIALLSALAFATGLGISMLEFVCTGQVLFPIMAVIKSSSPLKITAFIYLLIYNTMFILPLLIILALFYKGFSSEKLGEMQKRGHGAVKLATAAVLAVVGIYMLLYIF
ncbi:MAG: hypothetical protein FE043_00710 [Thermoplasmata archaeon]|nr:MAG: hypothetical protein FE043_00710 [Thermoplasmata archaeon]